MAIQNIGTQSLKSAVSFKQDSKKEAKDTQTKKHSTAKTIAWTAASVAAVAALTVAGIKMAKSGKLNQIKQELKSFVNKPNKAFTFRGTKTQSFESSKAMADEIVAEMNAVEKRIKGHNLVQHRYNKMDWSADVLPRAEVIK